MSMPTDIENSVEEIIVLALKERPRTESRERESLYRSPARQPQTPKTPVSLETALDEVMERYPKTLEYLGR